MDISNFLAGQMDFAKMAASQPDGTASTGALKRAAGEQSPAEMHKAGQEFEAYFISYLIKNMRDTVPKGLLDRKGEEVWYSFYDQEIAKLATHAGGIGITAFVDAYMSTPR